MAIDRVNSVIDYGTNLLSPLGEAISSNSIAFSKSGPDVVKKASYVFKDAIKMADHFGGKTHSPGLLGGLSAIGSFFPLYDLCRNMIYWKNMALSSNSFEVKNLDINSLKNSIHKALPKSEAGKDEDCALVDVDAAIDNLIKSKASYSDKYEFIKALKEVLSKSFPTIKADEVIGKVDIKLSNRAKFSIGMEVTGTIYNVDKTVKTLDQINLIDCGRISAQIGNKAPVFLTIMNKTVEYGMKGFMVLSMISIVYAARDIMKARNVLQKATCSIVDGHKASITIKRAYWDIAASVAILASLAIPMVFVVSTPVVLVLGIIANGTSIVKVFAKPS